MEKWAFFLDIDGTTAVNGIIPDENITAINEAVKNGHYVFLCTGRPFSMTKTLLDVANWSGIICSMGAEVIIDGTFVRRETVSDEFAKEVTAKLLKTDYWAFVGNGKKLLAFNGNCNSPHTKIRSMQEFEELYSGITKIDMSRDISEEIINLISKEMDIIFHSWYAEASIKGISKSEGIAFVLNELGIDRKFSVAVGDSLNDMDMIEYAGIGVAMGNATEEVKRAADDVCGHVAEDGIYHYCIAQGLI